MLSEEDGQQSTGRPVGSGAARIRVTVQELQHWQQQNGRDKILKKRRDGRRRKTEADSRSSKCASVPVVALAAVKLRLDSRTEWLSLLRSHRHCHGDGGDSDPAQRAQHGHCGRSRTGQSASSTAWHGKGSCPIREPNGMQPLAIKLLPSVGVCAKQFKKKSKLVWSAQCRIQRRSLNGTSCLYFSLLIVLNRLKPFDAVEPITPGICRWKCTWASVSG